MQKEVSSYTATAQYRPFFQQNVLMTILILIMWFFIAQDEHFQWNDFGDILLYGTSFYLGVYLVVNLRLKKIHYKFTTDELVIETGWRKTTRVPLANLKRWSVSSIEKPTDLIGAWGGGVYTGMWRMQDHELHLYATRQDRLVLLDTTQGLFGVSPDPAEEQEFLHELQQRTGLTEAQGYFEPRHAQRAVAIWPLIVLVTALGMSATFLMEQYWGHDNDLVRVVQFVGSVWLALSLRMLYGWLRKVPRMFKGTTVAVCLLYVGLLVFY